MFRRADVPASPEGRLWREVVARLVLDSLGDTGFGGEPTKHNRVMRDARLFLKFEPEQLEEILDRAELESASLRSVLLAVPAGYVDEEKPNPKEKI